MPQQFWFAGALILLALCCLLTLTRVRLLEKEVEELRGKGTNPRRNFRRRIIR